MITFAPEYKEKVLSNLQSAKFQLPVKLATDANTGKVKGGSGLAIMSGLTKTRPIFRFTPSVLRAAASKLVGKKMFIDHSLWGDKPSFRDEAAIITSAEFNEAEQGIGISFSVYDDVLATKLANKEDVGVTHTTSLSAVVFFKFERSNDPDNPDEVMNVTEIQEFQSVDFVFDAGSPGSRVTSVEFSAIDPKLDPRTISLADFLDMRPEYQTTVREGIEFATETSTKIVSAGVTSSDHKGEFTPPNQSKEDDDMTPEEMAQLKASMGEAVTQALKPYDERIGSIEERLNTQDEAVKLSAGREKIRATLTAATDLSAEGRQVLYAEFAATGDHAGLETKLETLREAKRAFTATATSAPGSTPATPATSPETANANLSPGGVQVNGSPVVPNTPATPPNPEAPIAGNLQLGANVVPLNPDIASGNSGAPETLDHARYHEAFFGRTLGNEEAAKLAAAGGSGNGLTPIY